MHISLTLTRPDGTPLAEDDLPAKGTLVVLQLDEVRSSEELSAIARLVTQPSVVARVIGWVPGTKADAAARRLLCATCRALNIRDTGEGASGDHHRSAVRAPG